MVSSRPTWVMTQQDKNFTCLQVKFKLQICSTEHTQRNPKLSQCKAGSLYIKAAFWLQSPFWSLQPLSISQLEMFVRCVPETSSPQHPCHCCFLFLDPPTPSFSVLPDWGEVPILNGCSKIAAIVLEPVHKTNRRPWERLLHYLENFNHSAGESSLTYSVREDRECQAS